MNVLDEKETNINYIVQDFRKKIVAEPQKVQKKIYATIEPNKEEEEEENPPIVIEDIILVVGCHSPIFLGLEKSKF